MVERWITHDKLVFHVVFHILSSMHVSTLFVKFNLRWKHLCPNSLLKTVESQSFSFLRFIKSLWFPCWNLCCSVGKSTLLTMLTGTHSEAASYEFTTLTCIPGIIQYNDTKIQLLDLPGIIEGASEGKGRGRQVNFVNVFIITMCTVHLCLFTQK